MRQHPGPLPFDPPTAPPPPSGDDSTAPPADRSAWRTTAGPDESTDGPRAHPVRPVPVGGRGPPDNESQSRRTGTGRSTPPATCSAWPPTRPRSALNTSPAGCTTRPGQGGMPPRSWPRSGTGSTSGPSWPGRVGSCGGRVHEHRKRPNVRVGPHIRPSRIRSSTVAPTRARTCLGGAPDVLAHLGPRPRPKYA